MHAEYIGCDMSACTPWLANICKFCNWLSQPEDYICDHPDRSFVTNMTAQDDNHITVRIIICGYYFVLHIAIAIPYMDACVDHDGIA